MSAVPEADLIFIPILREDILAAIGKHVTVDSDKVRVRIERGDMVSLLEIDIEIPTPVKHTREMRTTAVHLSRTGQR